MASYHIKKREKEKTKRTKAHHLCRFRRCRREDSLGQVLGELEGISVPLSTFSWRAMRKPEKRRGLLLRIDHTI